MYAVSEIIMHKSHKAGHKIGRQNMLGWQYFSFVQLV